MNDDDMNNMPEETCPRCGGPLRTGPTDVGALSRVDNETIVCGPCGSDEAMLDAMGVRQWGLNN
jgi:hypothetical protein